MNNDYEIRGDITAIYVNRKDGSVIETLISTADLDKVKSIPQKWCAYQDRGRLYIQGRIDSKTNVKLARFIVDAPKGSIVDHRNHDTLDNTRDNLRITNHSVNRINQEKASKNNTSGHVGVVWSKRDNKWLAYITVKGKYNYLGIYEDKEDAIKARKKKEEELGI